MIKWKSPFGSVSESRLRSAEEVVGKLPADYREFLLTQNGGRPDQREFKIGDADQPYSDSLINIFFGVHDERYKGLDGWKNDYSLEYQYRNRRREIDSDFLPVANDPFGNFVCLSLIEGGIFFWDHEQAHAPMVRVADSFPNFLNSLYETPEEPPKNKVLAAVVRGDTDEIAARLAKGYDQSRKIDHGRCLIEAATFAKQPDIVALCLQAKAEPAACKSAFALAVQNLEFDRRAFGQLVLQLMPYQEDVTVKQAMLSRFVVGDRLLLTSLLERVPAAAWHANEEGTTALHVSARVGLMEAFPLLLNCGAEIDARDAEGNTPLYACTADDRLHEMSELIRLGADVDAKDQRGRTPLHEAAEWDEVGAVNLLLEHGADRTIEDQEGLRPIDLAEDVAVRKRLKQK